MFRHFFFTQDYRGYLNTVTGRMIHGFTGGKLPWAVGGCQIRNLYLTNIFLNFHDEMFLWSTTSEGKSHVLPRLYLEFRPDDIFNTNLTAW